jgi:hypothetical protein
MTKKYLIVSIPILLYLSLKYLDIQIIPDFFGLIGVSAGDYFGLILNLTASVLGVLIAVVLLMFQMNKETFLRRKDENLMNKPMIVIIITVSLSILILGFISYVTILNFKTASDITLGYFIGILFIGFVALIFPAIIAILDELNTLKIVLDRIKGLTADSFFADNQRFNDYVSLEPGHPLHRIRHELIIAVRESDYEAYTKILSSLNQQAIELFGDAKNRILTNGILTGLTFIWQESIFEASRNNVQQFFKTLWDTIGGLYSYAVEKKTPLLHFQKIEDFIYEHIQFLGRNNLGDALSAGVWILADAFEKNLTANRPAQEEISSLYDLFEHTSDIPHNVDSSLQWDYIMRFIGFIHDIQSVAIRNQDRELYRTCQFHTNNVLNDISHQRFGNLGNYQEGALSMNILRTAEYLFGEALETGLTKTTLGFYEINTSFTKYAIDNKEFYVKEVMGMMSDFIIVSQRKGSLNSNTIQMFGAIGRHASKFFLGNDVANASIKFIVQTLKLMKEEIENTQLPGQVVNYQMIKKQLESQKDYLIRDKQGLDDAILTELQGLLTSFKSVAANKESNIVDWTV